MAKCLLRKETKIKNVFSIRFNELCHGQKFIFSL